MEAKLVLALGGGGVRGTAHLGVMRALELSGIPIHGIAGTSSGAIAAMIYAAEQLEHGRSRSESLRLIEHVGTRGFGELHHVFSPNPKQEWRDRLRALAGWEKVITGGMRGPGVIGLEPLRQTLLRIAGTTRFEDLPLPLAFVATDVMTSERVVMRHGPLVEAALASSAIPGIFAPVTWNDRLLFDGHVVDNVPVLAAKDLVDNAVVLAVDVSYEQAITAPKTAFEAIMRSAAISREHLRKQALAQADLVLTIGAEVPTSVFEVGRTKDLYEAGLEKAAALVPSIKALLAERAPKPEPEKTSRWRALLNLPTRLGKRNTGEPFDA